MDRPALKTVSIAQAVLSTLLMKKKRVEVGDSWRLGGGRVSENSGGGGGYYPNKLWEILK